MPNDFYFVRLIHGSTRTACPGERVWEMGHLLRASVLRFLRARNRQGFDKRGAQCFPESGLFAKAKNWVEAALVRIGADGRMGLKLYSSFIAAGLPAPSMSMDASTGGGAQSPGSVLLPEVIRSLLPVIERFGIATAEEVEIESLELRLRAEIAKLNAVTILPPLIGAWTKTPAWNNRCWISTP